MKKLIVFTLLICIALSICACGSTKTSSSSSSSSSYSSGIASLAEKEEAAEKAAISKVYSELQSDYDYERYGYDISATRYKVGKISSRGSKGDIFDVYLTLYLYDNYGSYKKSEEKKVTVTVDSYGNASGAYIGR